MQHSVVDDDLSRLAEEVYAEPAQTALGGSFFDDDLSRLAEEVYAEPVAAQHDSFGGDLALQARETLAAAPAPAQDDPLGPAILRGVQRAPAAIAEFMSDAATTLPGSLIKSGIEESRHYAPNSPAQIARQFPLTRPVAKFLPGYSEDELAPANLGMRSVMDAGADWLLAKGAANRKDIQDVRKAIDAGVPQYRQGKDFIDNPALLLNPAYLSEEALNAAGSMLPALGAAMAGGPLVGGMVGGSQEGLGALGQMLDDNMAPDEALVRSGAFGAASTALNALSFGKMLDKSVMDSLAQRGAKILASAGVEGFTEWLEGPVQALATTVGNLPVLKDGSTVAESARTGLAQARTDARPDDVVGAVTRAAREEAAVLPGAILTGGGINALTRAEDADGVIDLTDVVGAPAASFPPHAPSGPGAGTPSPRMGMRGQHDEVDLLAQPASSPAPPVPAARAVDAQAARLTDMDAPTQPFAPEPDAAPTDEDLDAVTRSLFSKPKSEVIDLTDVAQLPITVEQAPSQPFSTDEVRGMLPVWEQPTVTPMLEQPAPATLAPAPSAPEPSVSNAALESMDYDPFAEDGISADDAALVAIADELWPDEPAPATLAPEPSVSNAALEPVDYDPFAEDAISADDAALVAIADELWPDEPAPATLAPEPSVAPLAPDNAPSTEAVSPGRVGFSTFESPALPADQRTMEQAEASLVSQKADESDLRYLTRDTLERELDNVRYTHNKKPSKTRGLLVEQTAARLESFYKKNPDIERKQSPAHPADQRAMGQAGEVAAPGQRSAEGGAQKVAPRPLRSPSAALQSASDELRGASFWSDNPGGGWLSKEQDKARTERDDGYVSGSTTAGFKTVLLPVDAILSLPGQRGEESKLDSGQSDADIDAIAESMRASGYDKSEPIAVDVEFDGRTTIYEGNHRIRAAKRAGLTHVPVEIRYIAGGELVESPVSPERVLALVNAPVVKDSLTTETTGQSITHQEETPLGSLDISFENQDRAFSDQETQGEHNERGEAGHVGGAGQRGFGFGGLGQPEPGGLRADVGRRDGESDGRGARGIAPSRIEIPGSSESVEYHVAEGSEVRASHDPLGDFDRRVDYPFVNERAYHKGGRERDKVVEHALDLKPSLLLEAPTAMDGAPVVDQNMNVLGGNSRAMSVQYAYAKSPANAAKYRAALEDWAGAKGLDVDAIRAMKQPILVRKLTEPVDAERAKKLIPALNEGFTQAVDPEAQGVSRGARISADSFDMLSAGLEDHDTLRDFLDSRGSKFFVDALVGDGAMDKTRLTAVYRNGELTKEGKAEIERMVRGAVVPDYELLDALPQSLLNALDKALPSLVRLRSRGEGWDIGPAMVLALRHVARFRNGNGKHLDMYFRTPEMFGEIEGKKNRVVQILAHALHHMGHAQFGKAAAEYARLAFASQPRTRMLPGMGQLLPTKSAALEKFRTPQTPEALFAATQAATQDQTEPDDEPGAPASDSEKPNDLAAPASSPNAERDEYVALFDEELAAHETASRPAAPRTKPADVQRKEARDRAKATAKPGQSLSSAQKKMEAAARKMAKGAAQALDVFSKYGGLSVREVKDGDALDQNLYSELKPHLVTVMEGAREMGYAGKELAREVVRFLIKTFGAKAAQAKPYFMRFVDEEILTKGERNADDKFASQGVERDGRGRAEDGLGAGNVDAGRRGDSGRRGAGRGPAGQPGRGLDAGAGVSGRAPAAAGTGSDSAVRADAPGAARRAAGGELDQRGNPDRDRGLAPGSVGDGAVADAARASERRAELGRAEAPAGQTKGDLDNIAATLPSLLPGQHQDVAFAEKRFEKGAGVLFTNGTGTGKTGSGLGIVQRLVRAGKKNILIAAPSADIARAWVDFAKKFLGLTVTPLKSTKDAGSGVVVTTHANLGANAALATRQWDLLVMDEAHKLMSSEQAKDTRALDALRALGMHKNGARALARMRRPDLFQAWKDAPAQSDDFTKKQNEEIAATKKAWEDHMEAVRAEVAAAQGQNRARLDAPAEGRPGVVFLSATPFSYEFNVDYTEGFLFDYAEVDSSAYNSGDGRARFFMQHFGYRMRTGTLTKPDANVDSGLMQRQFNSWLKKEGALSLRLLDVAHDYDRKFVLVESAVGRTIDEGLDWLRADKRMGPLLDEINARFDHLSRRYLLEAIKAKEAVPLIRQNMDLGRKVVVFHDYKKGGGFNPFDVSHLLHSDKDVTYHAGGKQVTVRLGDLAKEFMDARPDLQRLPLQGLHSPLVTLSREFPDMLVLNGDIAAKDRATALEQFQADDSGKNLILVQSAAGEAGISLHDTTGRHQRVLINLGLPTRPVTAIQQEGRIFRVGQKSNAMFRYLNTGTNWERWAFASTIAGRASTAENLSLGEEARALKEGFIQAFEESDAWAPGHGGEGTGGKERDASAAAALTAWDRAKTMYFGQQKKTSRTKSAEGADYFATPEPLGLKMVEWAGITPDMDVLEPSAGHGAIARWFPDLTRKTMIEPSHELASRLALVADGRIVSDRFEDHHAVNKYDAIIMNPPFGTAGKMAMEHVAKAFAHLRDGGRLVALIPRGSSMEKRFDAWHESEAAKDAHLRMSVDLPSVTFERAGTTVAARVVVIDKAEKPVGHVDARTPSEIGGATIGEFFDNLEGRTAPDRIVTEAAQAQAEIEEQERARGAFFDAVDTKHTKTGEPLYVARKSGLLSQDEYKRVAALAKGHGGWWSSFKGKGAVPGFQFKDRAKRAAFLKEAREMLAGSDPDVRMSRASVAPWPVGFPKAFSHTTVSKVTGHPDYDAAKAGNLDAARRLVADLVKPERLKELAERFPGAVVVPVEEVEAKGVNRIPYALAEAIAGHGLSMLGAPIYQTSTFKRKDLDAVARLKARKVFEGEVAAGRKYVLVDDILTQGGTVHELRTHIVNNGGEVVAVSSLAFSAGSNIIAIQQDTIDSIVSRFGRERTEQLLRDHNVTGTLEALTESEGRA
ncbi:MAG: DEAD/DEAH box helicase, partial [Spartobacteria bacterium]|nr:DEAD/DEAH box helicase [Spartobacteria bacterium]